MTDRSDLVINGYGASLRKKSNRFVIEHEGETHEYAAPLIRQILITGAASISSGALQLAAEQDVDVVVTSQKGELSCRLMPCHGGGIATVRRAQINAPMREEGYYLTSSAIRAKITHQGRLLTAMGRRRDDQFLISEGERIASLASHIPQKGKLSDLAGELRGKEGDASHSYFSALGRVIPPPIYPGHRSHRSPADPCNAALNYGYGILYNEIEKACILSGLDPYAGFLHADRYGHKALVYDLIEPYRQPVVDRIILTLAVKGLLEPGDLDEKGYLISDARRRIITAVISRLDDEREIAGKKTTFRTYIRDDMHRVARYLAEGKPYTPLDWKWH